MDKHRIEGAAKQAKGAVKEAVGKAVGDSNLVAEGKSDKAEAESKRSRRLEGCSEGRGEAVASHANARTRSDFGSGRFQRARLSTWRPSQTWGRSCCHTKERRLRPTLPWSTSNVPLTMGDTDLEHQMIPTWRPAHLLARSHPAMQQPLHGKAAANSSSPSMLICGSQRAIPAQKLSSNIQVRGSRLTSGSSSGWRAGLPPSPEGLDDGHAPAAAGTGRQPIEWFWHFDGLRRWRHGKQFAGTRDIGLACGTGEQAVMADAVEATWQDMEQEAPDELVRREGHDALPLGTIAAIVLVAEGDAGLVERDQAPVGDGDPVGIAREIGEHGLGAGERRLGIDHEALLPDRGEVTQEKAAVGETGLRAEEGKSSRPYGVRSAG